MLVDDGTHTFLVLVVAIEESQLLLHQLLSLGNVDVFGCETPVLVLHKDVDIPFFVENIAVIVASKHFGMIPHLLGNNIVLCLYCADGQQHKARYDSDFLHIISCVSHCKSTQKTQSDKKYYSFSKKILYLQSLKESGDTFCFVYETIENQNFLWFCLI